MGVELNTFYLKELNEKIVNQQLPINEITELKLHKQCKENNKILSQFRMGIEPTKNYYYTRQQGNECIPCWLKGVHKLNTGQHVYFSVGLHIFLEIKQACKLALIN